MLNSVDQQQWPPNPDSALSSARIADESPSQVDIGVLVAALAFPVAVLDYQGRIVALSEAWRHFPREGMLISCAVGEDYVDGCRFATGPLASEAHKVSGGIFAVLERILPHLTFEYSYQAADEQRWILLQVTPIGSATRGVVVELTDITARKRTGPGPRLDGSDTSTRTHDVAKRRPTAIPPEELLMAIASHELRTPIAVIKSYLSGADHQLASFLQQLEGAWGPGDDGIKQEARQALMSIQQAIQHAQQAASQMSSVVGDLFFVSRAHSGKAIAHPEHCDLALLARQIVEQQRAIRPTRRLLLHLRRNQHILVDADPERVGQALTNFLDNAHKYSPEDQPVDVFVNVTAAVARVAVRDQGSGVAPDERLRIWDAFYQAEVTQYQPRRLAGLGIGLYVTRLIVEQLGGQVGVEHETGYGSTFWFTLPLVVESSEH